MHSSYYSRSPAASLLEQRGETAVLGAGPPTIASSPLHDRASVDAIGAATPRIAGPSALPPALRSSRGIGKRKLRRSENARLSSNPHVVRPSARDYSLRHNDRNPSFPIPSELQQVYAASMRGEAVSSSDSRSNSQPEGPYTMSHSDAHWFLAHRCGIRPRGPEFIIADPPVSDDARDSRGLGAIQLFVRQAEAIMAAWLVQDVFMQPAASTQAGHASPETTLIDLRSLQTGLGDARDLRLVEVARNPHNLVWSVPDPFMRLAIHCLARTMACPSFSKDAPRRDDEGTAGQTATRQTWILKGRSYGVKGSRSTSTPAAQGFSSALPSDIDTPPATDVASELASDIAHSEVASEAGSDWVVSDIAEDCDIDDSDLHDDWQTAADVSQVTQRGDETLGMSEQGQPDARGHQDEETGDWADVESDGGR